MTVKQIVIERNKDGKVTNVTLHHHEHDQGPVLLFYNPPVNWDIRIPETYEKTDMLEKRTVKRKKHPSVKR